MHEALLVKGLVSAKENVQGPHCYRKGPYSRDKRWGEGRRTEARTRASPETEQTQQKHRNTEKQVSDVFVTW